MKYGVLGGFVGAFTLTAWLVLGGCRVVEDCAIGYKHASTYDCVKEGKRGYLPHGGCANPNGEPYAGMFFENYGVNPFVDTEDDRYSTFAVDVDTGSYTVARNYLNRGNIPPKDAIRVEEFINYFDFYYPPPEKEDFGIYLEAAPSRFGTETTKMIKIGLKGREIEARDRKPAMLVFVIDVSGSMNMENRLGLVKKTLKLLVEQMRADDEIGIVVYGSRGRVITEPLSLEYRDSLLDAIERLYSEGSTNAGEGLKIAYEMAARNYRKSCINRVILCSDGVANMGATDAEGVLSTIRDSAQKGIYLSTVGFGMGNYNDVMMEKLADKGDGNYAYVDNLEEARRVFVGNLNGTLQVIAKDVKVQVEFDSVNVRSWRLLGYENRDVEDEDFRDDKVDGGEVGAGHSVTVLYEIKLHENAAGKLASVYVRYKNPDSGSIVELSEEIVTSEILESFQETSEHFRLAAVVAEFAEILRESYWSRGSDLRDLRYLANQLAPEFDNRKDVLEFAGLVEKTLTLKPTSKENEEENIREAGR